MIGALPVRAAPRRLSGGVMARREMGPRRGALSPLAERRLRASHSRPGPRPAPNPYFT